MVQRRMMVVAVGCSLAAAACGESTVTPTGPGSGSDQGRDAAVRTFPVKAAVAEVRRAVAHDRTIELRRMPPIPPIARPMEEEEEEVPNRRFPFLERTIGRRPTPDEAVQAANLTSALTAPTTLASFDGINNVNGVLPPDSTGAIGPDR